MVKVSVIMPFYNQSNYVDEAVQSILQQTYKDFELIIINDGSTEPGVEDLLNKYQSNQIKVLHTSNQGVAAARNLGITVSTGTYILPLDADDYIHPQMLEATVSILDGMPSVNVVRTGVEYVGAAHGTYFLPAYNRTQHLLQNLFFNTSLMRRNLLLAIGGYDEKFTNGWEDWEMFLRYVNDKNQVYSLNKTYLYYRIKTKSRNADIVMDKKEKVEQQLYKKHLDLYLQYFSNPISLIREQQYLELEKIQFEAAKQKIYDSRTYRLGNLLLKPLKLLRRNR